ncbi:hypothetical protein [Halosimplex amylolyticum]|uniref:hypothetical protein n=1 Tax=Halosimplex amylolyticum TaxID=3396616 RepID=UPI003F55014D
MTVSGDALTGGRLADVRAAVARYRLPPADDVRAVGGVLAAAAVCLLVAARVAINAPLGRSPAGIQSVHTVASAGAVVVPAAAAVALGAVADADRAVVGLVAAGVFSLLAPLASPAGLPAVGVLPVAALLVTVPAGDGDVRSAPDRWLFAGLVTAGVAAALGATTGVLGPDARSIGTLAAFLALAAAPAVVGVSRRALSVGAVVAVAVAAGSLAAPFVAGATLLAVGAAVDPGVAVAALGLGGGGAVVADGAFRRQRQRWSGGLLLVAAGVPATVPRALAVVLGAHLLLVTTARSGDEADGGDPS